MAGGPPDEVGPLMPLTTVLIRAGLGQAVVAFASPPVAKELAVAKMKIEKFPVKNFIISEMTKTCMLGNYGLYF